MIEYKSWRKSTRSDGGQDCVEVSDAVDGSAVRVRDSKDPGGPALGFTGAAWKRFVEQAKSAG